jgi:lipopolysaccharide export system permease protein
LLATLFALNRLKTHNELTAALAAGYSYLHISALIAGCSLVVAFAQFGNLGFLEPYANKVKRQEIKKSQVSEGKYLTRSSAEGGQFWFKSKDYFATFLTFNKETASLVDVNLFFFDTNGNTTRILVAKQADYHEDQNWYLRAGQEITDLEGSRFPRQEFFNERLVGLHEKPSDFAEFEADLTTLSWPALALFINRIAPTGINTAEYRVLLHQKGALSLMCLVFALVPLGGLFRPNRRSDSFGKNVAFALILTILFWLLFSAALSYGQNGKIPPWIAAYTIPFLFLVQSAWAQWHHRKLKI